MKKSLLALVIASVIPAAAFADVTVYGKANVSLQSTDEASYSTANGNQTDGSKVELLSNASRIGVKGGEEVNSKLKVIYQFEYQTEVDDGTGGGQTLTQRNIYLGLQGIAGTLMGGNFDTPTKVAQEKIDLFNDLEGDIIQILKGEIRASNIVQYVTPTFGGGFSGAVAYVSEETDGVDLIRVVGRLTLGAFQFGLLGESYDNDNTGVDDEGVVGSAMWNVTDKWALKAQYGDSDVKWIDSKSASLGLDYKMTKSATLYGYYTMVENGMPDLVEPAVDTYRDDSYAGVGLDYKF